MRSTLLFAIFLLTLTTRASISQADKAYEEGDFTKAVELYSQSWSEDQLQPELDYNLGNALYRSNQLGKAIYHWERALKGDPGMLLAKENLELAYSMVEDDEPTNRPSDPAWYISLAMMGMPSLWATLALVGFILVTVLGVLFLLRRDWRRWAFMTSTSLAIVAALMLGLHFIGLSHIRSLEQAIVLPSFLEVKTAPTANGVRTFEVHAGTKLELVRQKEEWCEVQLGDRRGWVPSSAVGLY